MLEREGELGPRALGAGGKLGAPVGVDQLADPLELVVADGRVPLAHGFRPGRRQLEQAVHGIADLRRRQPAFTCDRLRPPLAQPGEPLRVVAVGAALVERERRVREPPHPVQGRLRHGREFRQPVAANEGRNQRGRVIAEEGELTVLGGYEQALLPVARVQRVRPVAVGPDQERRLAALQLELLAGVVQLGLALEPAEDPPDRRLASVADRARDDQPVDRARHRDVVEPEAFLVLGGPLALPLRVAQREVLLAGVGAGLLAPRVGDDDDLELEPLRGVDRQQPHRARALLLGDRLELRGAGSLLVGDEAEEALEVTAAQLLVRAREPHQLAQVRVATLAVPAREHGEVVVVLGDDELAEPLERDARRGGDEPLVPLLEGADQALVGGVERDRHRPLETGVERPAPRMPAQEHERVVRDAHERRRKYRHERLVVVAVPQQAQVHAQVDDLLLAEVPPAGRAVRRQAERAQFLLIPLGIRARGEEQDDLARSRRLCVDELAHAPGHVLRLGAAPVRAAAGIRLLVGDEQLDGVPEDGVGKLARGGERLVALAERRAEEVVDRCEHLRPRAVVLGQRQPQRRSGAARAEDVDVRVAERVDRLELVADEEDVLLGPAGEEVDQLALKRVRILELVDHDRAEAQLLRFADAGVVREQVAREQLQVLEVERRLALLAGRVLHREKPEQLLEQLTLARGDHRERGLLELLAGLLVARRPRPARAEGLQLDEPLRLVGEVEGAARGGLLVLGRAGVVEQALRCLAQRLERGREIGLGQRLEHERASRRAQALVDRDQVAAQLAAAGRREQAQPVGGARGEELLERAFERLAAQHGALLLVELAEARVDPDGERVCAQEPGAEAVDGRDPGAVELLREVEAAALAELAADARPQLSRRLARVGDHEHRLHVEALVADRAHEALDEHARLARAGAGGDEHLPLRVDRGELLLVHARPTRHIVQRSHQDGHSPPRGSCATSPARIRRAAPSARARARSTCSQNEASSR